MCLEAHCPENPCNYQAEPWPATYGTTTSEIRTVSSTGGEKGVKLARFDLIPAVPLRQVAEHFGRGAQKYEDRNWERGYEWSKSYGALQRHANAFWSGEDVDEETGSPHMAAVVFHALALLEFAATHPDFDDRPTLSRQTSTETPDPVGCVVTVTGDIGDTCHNFKSGTEVLIIGTWGDHTLKCADPDGHFQYVAEVDLA